MKFRQNTLIKSGIALVACGAAFGSMPAASASVTVGMSAQEKFQSLDTDRDGFLSRAESRKIRSFDKAFTEADENHDGRLNADEFVKAEAIFDRLQAAAYLDDSVITAKVKTALLKQPKLNSLDVSVETYQGHVLLSGFVNDAKQRDQALQVASSVRGVVDVKDGLTLK